MDDPQRLFWWDKIHLAVHRTSRRRVRLPWPDHREVDLADVSGRRTLTKAAEDHLRRVPEPGRGERLEALLHELGDPDMTVPRQMLSWDEVRQASGLTTWGGHTHTHPIMSLLDAAQLEGEVRLCRERIESETGVRPRYFAYPNGKSEDFTPEVSAALARHGFEIAFATEQGLAGPGTDWLAVKRLAGSGNASRNLAEFAWVVSGLGAA
jgi:peptidoglycan/xylan/chitin deacetylase (PgdA/CDA1 family)